MEGRSGRVTLIDEGVWVCNAIYIDDVCDAIHAALLRDEAVGEAMFVNGDDVVPWREFNLEFARLANPRARVVSISSAEIRNRLQSTRPTLRANGRALIQLAAAPELHRLISTVPTLGLILGWTKQQLSRRLSEDQKLAHQDPPEAGYRRPRSVGVGVTGDRTADRGDLPDSFLESESEVSPGMVPEIQFRRGKRLDHAVASLRKAPGSIKLSGRGRER